jgi:hypothetical protein
MLEAHRLTLIGAPIHLFQATLRHSSVATTSRYLFARLPLPRL